MGHNNGELFESIIIMANNSYLNKNIANIQKIATPMKAKKNALTGEVQGCIYGAKSTVDFVGVYQGKAIAFDAKTTIDENKFPLKNWKEHQVEFLQKWEECGGVAFCLLWLQYSDKYYLITQKMLVDYWDKHQENKGKRGFGSIPFEVIERECIEVQQGEGITIDYLSCIDQEL